MADVSKHFIGIPISTEGQNTLLKIARFSIEKELGINNANMEKNNNFFISDELKWKRGTFVTLEKMGQLRGCIGHIAADMEIAEVVSKFAVYSALNDHRFPPVKKEELNSIKISISVMSPFKKIQTPDEFIPGVHGILLKKGQKQAIFLPQVATEQGWDRETTLMHLCHKADLDINAWKDKNCEFLIYTAQVFSDK